MKQIKAIFFFVVALFFSTSTFAEIYHGIDIDQIYTQSDWNNKDEIKEIIDDYALLLQYKKELPLCLQDTDIFPCLDKLAENIMKRFYVDMGDNMKSYHDYVKATSSAYGVVFCLNKYRVPPGTICSQENIANTWKFVERYIKDMLQQVENEIIAYSFISNYKE